MDWTGITIGLIIGSAGTVPAAVWLFIGNYMRRLDVEDAAEDARRDERERRYNGTA